MTTAIMGPTLGSQRGARGMGWWLPAVCYEKLLGVDVVIVVDIVMRG